MPRALLAAAAALALAAFLYGCGGSANTPAGTPEAPQSCAPARTHAAGETSERLQVDGVDRTYILRVPPGYDGSSPAALMLAFHAFTVNGRVLAEYTQLGPEADAAVMVSVFPDALAVPPRWNTHEGAGGADDVGFVRALLADLEAKLCVDGQRIYATGHSSGGGMAQMVACAMPDRIAAIGLVAAVFLTCRADVPMIAFHGSADPVLPYDGGPSVAFPINFLPVRRSVTEWAQALGCDGLAIVSRPSSEVELSTFKRCSGGDGEVLLYTIIDGGHTWPGADAPLDIVGKTTQQVDATKEIVRFFRAHPKPSQ